MAYRLLVEADAAAFLAQLSGKDFALVMRRVLSLAQTPRPPGAALLKEFKDPKVPSRQPYRVRQGDYRILYLVDDAHRSVTVYVVDHRRDVYR